MKGFISPDMENEDEQVITVEVRDRWLERSLEAKRSETVTWDVY